MSLDSQRVKSIFLAAADLPADARPNYLAEACGGDAELRRRVEGLLAAHEEAGDPVETVTHHPSDVPGVLIAGRYKLLEPAGEGGMGTVWMAEQREPVKRLVAVKLIKSGMDSKAVLARFEAERQALAMMDHPNIAKVLDGGTTPDGRPFFVMELVKGVSITQYCDRVHLTPRERLQLFIPVCQAVQHAHQKGVIHRDLKPSNVLVALYDGTPVPKIIDFGVAKATGQALTDKTLHTGFGAVVGTPQYMSPEQAELNNLDIDTRSDIYSLGVLLYELIAGSPPFEEKALAKAGLLEAFRVIREEEPPRPSTKLGTSTALPTIAANRGTEPKKLTGLIRGEIDWIVMKALEKNRGRRYETANGFAQDVQRYLADEPVLAGPPTAGYRLRKFVHRNRTRVTVAAVLLVALVGGIVGTTWGLVRTEEARADESKQRQEAQRLQREADDERKKAEWKAASAAIDLDLSHAHTHDSKLGLLRLARRLRSLPEHATDLRQFLVMSVFGWGQDVARVAPGPHLPAAILSPDGRTLLRTDIASGGTLTDLLTGRDLVELWDKSIGAWHFEFSADGGAVMMNDRDVVRVWDVASRRLRSQFRPGQFVNDVYLNPSATRLVTITDPERLPDNDPRKSTLIQLWDGTTGRMLARLDHAGGTIAHLRFSPDGETLITSGPGNTARAWSAEGQLLHAFVGHASSVLAATFSPSGRRVATCDHNRVLWWRTTDWQPEGVACAVTLGDAVRPDPGRLYARFLHEDVMAAYFTDMDENRYGITSENLCVFGEPKGHKLDAVVSDGEMVLTRDDRVYALRPLRRLDSPEGRRYPENLRRLAVDNRFLKIPNTDTYDRLIDLQVERPIQFQVPRLMRCPAPGCSFSGVSHLYPMVLPAADLAIDPDTLDSWARVLVRGELDAATGFLVKHDEATWERNRQELLRRPKPPGEFPFPGAFVEDRLYWLRKEVVETLPHNALPLHDRLVAAEPTWQNYHSRAEICYQLGDHVRAINDALKVHEFAKGRNESYSLLPGSSSAEAIVFRANLPREKYGLALKWYETVTPKEPSRERGMALYRLGRFEEALTEFRRPEANAIAKAFAGFMTPFALVEAIGLEADEVRTMAIGLCELRLGKRDSARAKLDRARIEHQGHYTHGGWSFHTGVRSEFMAEAEAAIDGKK